MTRRHDSALARALLYWRLVGMLALDPRHVPLAPRCLGALALALMFGASACGDESMRPVSFGDTKMDTDTGDGEPGDGEPGDGDPGDGDPGDGDPGDGDPAAPPMVVDTSPAPGTVAVSIDAQIVVTFSETMDAASVTTNGGSTACGGAIRVSDDDFATCVPLNSAVDVTENQTVFAATPTALLDSRRDYVIRVADYATSQLGVELGEDFTAAASFQTRYAHTVTIDGVNDFDGGDETFMTTSQGFSAYVAWDLDYVYLGLEGVDVASGNPSLFLVAYLGGNGGSMNGVTYQGQTPALPFSARWHLRWKSDDTYTNLQEYSGGWIETAGSWPQASDWTNIGEYVEMRIPRAVLVDPTTLPLVMALLREANGEATYAGLPATTFSDGFDPDFSTHFEFDLDGSMLPVEHPIL